MDAFDEHAPAPARARTRTLPHTQHTESTKSILVLRLAKWLYFSANSRVVQNKFIIQFLDNLILLNAPTELGRFGSPRKWCEKLWREARKKMWKPQHSSNAKCERKFLGCENEREKKSFFFLLHTSKHAYTHNSEHTENCKHNIIEKVFFYFRNSSISSSNTHTEAGYGSASRKSVVYLPKNIDNASGYAR